MDNYLVDMPVGYASDSNEIGPVTAAEQTVGTKQVLFKGRGRNISVGMYQWGIVVGAVGMLWLLGFNLRSLLKG